jgi:hypothetical protein
MARRFFYTSLGILCLTAAYQLGAERARADWQPSGAVFGVWQNNGAAGLIDHFGQAWQLSEFEGFERHEQSDLPVPVEEVRLFSDGVLVTQDEDVYISVGLSSWRPVGRFPGGPVSVQPESWGSVKARFRE